MRVSSASGVMAPIRDQSPLKAASTRPAMRRRESAGRAPRRRTDPCPGPSPLVAHGRPPSSRPRLEIAHRLPRKPLHPALTDPKSPPNFRGLIPPGSIACGLARPPLPSSPLLRRLWRSGLRRRSRVFLSSGVVGSIPTGCFFCGSSFVSLSLLQLVLLSSDLLLPHKLDHGLLRPPF